MEPEGDPRHYPPTPEVQAMTHDRKPILAEHGTPIALPKNRGRRRTSAAAFRRRFAPPAPNRCGIRRSAGTRWTRRVDESFPASDPPGQLLIVLRAFSKALTSSRGRLAALAIEFRYNLVSSAPAGGTPCGEAYLYALSVLAAVAIGLSLPARAAEGPLGIGFAQAEEGTWWCQADGGGQPRSTAPARSALPSRAARSATRRAGASRPDGRR